MWGGDSDFNLKKKGPNAAEAPQPVCYKGWMEQRYLQPTSAATLRSQPANCEVNTSPQSHRRIQLSSSPFCFDELPPFGGGQVIICIFHYMPLCSHSFYKVCLARKWLQNVHVHLYMHEAGWFGCSTSSIFNASRPEMWSSEHNFLENLEDLIDQPSSTWAEFLDFSITLWLEKKALLQSYSYVFDFLVSLSCS